MADIFLVPGDRLSPDAISVRTLFLFNKSRCPQLLNRPNLYCPHKLGRFTRTRGFPFEVSEPGGKRDWIEKLIYKPGTRANGDIALDKTLTVYGFRHPSARCGFCPEHYKDYLQKEIRL